MPRKKRKYEEYMTLGTDPDGKRIRKFICADTKPEFDRLRYEARKEFEQVRNPSDITFKSYADKWMEVFKANKALQTKAMYQYAINKCSPFHMKPLREVTASDLQGVVNKHAEHPRSCQQLKLTLKQIYKAAIRDGIIPPFNLAEDLAIPEYHCQERRFISDEEMEKIDQCKFQPLDGLYLSILRYTGMRPAEALALQWSDIDFSKHQIAVQRAFEFEGNTPKVKTTKTGKSRTVPLTDALAEMLKKEKKKGLLIITRDGSPFTKSMFNRLSDRILSRINTALGGNEKMNVLNGLSLYSFRHTFATMLYYNAVIPGYISTKKAAAILGHSEQMFLSRYTHINDAHENLEVLTSGQVFKQGDQKETKQA